MTIIRRLFGLDTIETLIKIGYGYQEVVREQAQMIENLQRKEARYRLEHTRAIRDLVEHFFIAQEAGLDVREELEKGLSDLNDEVARQEEHAPR